MVPYVYVIPEDSPSARPAILYSIARQGLVYSDCTLGHLLAQALYCSVRCVSVLRTCSSKQVRMHYVTLWDALLHEITAPLRDDTLQSHHTQIELGRRNARTAHHYLPRAEIWAAMQPCNLITGCVSAFLDQHGIGASCPPLHSGCQGTNWPLGSETTGEFATTSTAHVTVEKEGG
jgi:hypothetical protein